MYFFTSLYTVPYCVTVFCILSCTVFICTVTWAWLDKPATYDTILVSYLSTWPHMGFFLTKREFLWKIFLCFSLNFNRICSDVDPYPNLLYGYGCLKNMRIPTDADRDTDGQHCWIQTHLKFSWVST